MGGMGETMTTQDADVEGSGSAGVVAVVHCKDYDSRRVTEAVARGFGLLAGTFARPGERILLKPNLLSGHAPEKVVTTHPAVFGAVARQVLDMGANVSYGDSPGFGRPVSVARKAGLVEVAEELGLPLADFTNGVTVSFPEGRLLKQFVLAQGVLDSDGIISLPKLKTHALMRMTGAVKNQFGCIPGMLKGEFHARMVELERFAQMLVDLTRCVSPRLYVMDAITAMEGNGPGSGTPRDVGALLFSTDPVAMDTVACRLIGLDPMLVLTNRLGEDSGLGCCRNVVVIGDDVESLVVRDFDVNRRRELGKGALQPLVARWFKSLATPRPVIDPVRCTRCGTCVKVCPVRPCAVDFRNGTGSPPSYDYDACIRCYCCQEMCPDKAISVMTPRLGRLIHRS